jgi:hypothetical protein
VHLMFRTNLALERCSCGGCPILVIHDAIIGRLSAEEDALAITIGADAVEPGALSPAFEVVDVRWLQTRPCRAVGPRLACSCAGAG